ncbi:MAG: transposase [Verrucomicrobiae bacterium]|nr:transposase [Verrucomicrobiae bacterium]
MRISRILGDGPCNYYHVLSRVIERRFILGEQEQEHFRKLMRAQEAFSGVRVLTWNCMSNHFHMLVAVEDRESEEVQAELARLMVDDEAFLDRLKPLYAADVLDGIGKMLKVIRGREVDDEVDPIGGLDEAVEEEDVFAMENPTLTTEEQIERFKRPYLDRLYDLSSFVGEIKQRFSRWYNLRSERNGPLWEDRFKSVLVQGEPGVLATVAAYIDLNAVRAGLVKDPREWRWCGYAEALKSQGIARNGVYEVLGALDALRRDGEGWKKVHRRYRQLLMEEGRQLRDEENRVVRKGLTPEEFEAEEARDFELPAPALLHHRVRYFVDGLALGSTAFVESVFEKNRVRMGVKRISGARVPKTEMGGLRTLRDLRGGK